MKFQYSPGLIGYGPKGTNGIDGLSGMAFYFTDYEPELNTFAITNAIINNEVLWSKAEPGTKLPGGRSYVEGDLFISSRGYVYEITNITTGDYLITDSILSKVQFFDTDKMIAQEGFERWFNKYDPSSENRYLIDNNNSQKTNYLIPSQIYGIDLKDYVRIEYTDGSTFTLYSSAENTGSDEHKALALIRTSEGNFRLGNVDNRIRDVNLMFDVSSLRSNREHSFGINTPVETVITNSEKYTNLLFDPNFVDDPPSFILRPQGEFAYLDWNLADFTSDPNVKGTIVFSKKEPSTYTKSWTLNASVFNPMMFHNLDTAGSITINDLSIGTTYQYYMIVSKDGWERRSKLIETLETDSLATMTILDPASKILIYK